ncbi:MAG: molybdopterin dinucleotide binding domain-containing protein, partial [Anaerolineales bacterium]
VLAYTEREGSYVSGERRAQRFYPAVPARPGLKADYALTAEIATLAGVPLEGRSPLLVMNQIAAEVKAFAGLSYARLAEVEEQWPIVSRGDLYYGGTSYENKQGLGAHLAASDAAVAEALPTPLRPKEDELLAVPVSKVYDLGTTLTPARLLAQRTGGPRVALHPAAAEKLGIRNGDPVTVRLNGVEAQAAAVFDESISTGVVLVYRSFGIPIAAPTPVTLAVAEKA